MKQDKLLGPCVREVPLYTYTCISLQNANSSIDLETIVTTQTYRIHKCNNANEAVYAVLHIAMLWEQIVQSAFHSSS